MSFARCYNCKSGEMSEWLKEHAWKVCIRERIEGSNPSLSTNLSFVLVCCGIKAISTMAILVLQWLKMMLLCKRSI